MNEIDDYYHYYRKRLPINRSNLISILRQLIADSTICLLKLVDVLLKKK